MKLKYLKLPPKRYQNAELADFSPEFQRAGFDFLYKGMPWKVRYFNFDKSYIFTPTESRVLFLYGPTGTGKTHLGWAVAREFAKWAYVYGTTARALSEQVIEEGASKAKQAPLLMIDEINRTFETDAEHKRFFDIIDHRYSELLPTIIIGNTDKNSLKSTLGDALARRLGENMVSVPMLKIGPQRAS